MRRLNRILIATLFTIVSFESTAARSQDKEAKVLCESQKDMQAYLEARWPIWRIKEYCRKETRWIPGRQSTKRGATSLKGALFTQQKDELGNITWFEVIEKGQPPFYEIDVAKDSLTIGFLNVHQ